MWWVQGQPWRWKTTSQENKYIWCKLNNSLGCCSFSGTFFSHSQPCSTGVSECEVPVPLLAAKWRRKTSFYLLTSERTPHTQQRQCLPAMTNSLLPEGTKVEKGEKVFNSCSFYRLALCVCGGGGDGECVKVQENRQTLYFFFPSVSWNCFTR